MPLSRGRTLLILATVALVPRFFLARYLGVWGEPEVWEYDTIAANIHQGIGHVFDRRGFVYLAYAPPVWSYLLAALLALPGHTRAWIQVAQGLFCFGSALTCGALVRKLGGSRSSELVCAVLVVLQPSLLYYSAVKSDPLPLNALLLVLIALMGATVVAERGAIRSFGFGLLIAIATLSRGTPALALPVVAMFLLQKWRRGSVTPIIAMTLGMAMGLAPWLLRNAVLLGEPVITTTSGENFWRGNNVSATGGVVNSAGDSLTDLLPENPLFPAVIQNVLKNGTELDRQHIFTSEGWRFIRESPGLALELLIEKLRRFWWTVESIPGDYPLEVSVLYEWIYRIEAALALIGIVSLVRRRSPPGGGSNPVTLPLMLALMAVVSLLQSAFYVQGRHRFMIEPLLLTFTAIGLGALREGRRTKASVPQSGEPTHP